MNDRYLFRGKDGDKWFFGCLHICGVTNHHHHIINTDYDEFWEETAEINLVKNGVHEVNPTTIGQCTGLKDKNGKLIFEGDIVRMHDNKTLCVVEWGKGLWLFMPIQGNRLLDHSPLYSHHNVVELIGNIYDNSELLKTP